MYSDAKKQRWIYLLLIMYNIMAENKKMILDESMLFSLQLHIKKYKVEIRFLLGLVETNSCNLQVHCDFLRDCNSVYQRFEIVLVKHFPLGDTSPNT